jgi:hypothetical protein
MPESTIYPAEIEIDTIKNGVARVLCRWNIEAVLHEESLVYQYEEAVIRWSLPDVYTNGEQAISISTREDVEAYIQANATEIMSFAKATKLTM